MCQCNREEFGVRNKGLGPFYFTLFRSLSLFSRGIYHLPPLSPILKVKPFLHPPCSLTVLAEAINSFSFETGKGCEKRRLKSHVWPWSASPEASLKMQVLPSNLSLPPWLCTEIRGRAGRVPGPCCTAGGCCSLRQGQYFTLLSASAAALVLPAFCTLQLDASIRLFLQDYSFISYGHQLLGDFFNPGVVQIA